MRHGAAGRRGRNRGGNGGGGNRNRGGNVRAQVFDSNGPDVRIRGTAYQIQEKYAALAKDAASAGDQVLAESYLQHAEHYQRLINSWEEQYGQERTYDQQHQGQRQQYQQGQPQQQQQSAADDLGLPSSILGGPVARTEEQLEEV